MAQAVTRFLVWALMLAVSTAMAEQTADEMARVVTGAGLESECLAPLLVTRIDGVKRVMPAPGFLIEPGVHTINGRALLDTTKCRPLADDQKIATAPDLEVNFETGNIYYIAYDRSHPDTAEWKLVVWKVEQAGLPESQGVSAVPVTDNTQ